MRNKEMTMETKKEIFEDYMEDVWKDFLHPAPAIETVHGPTDEGWV